MSVTEGAYRPSVAGLEDRWNPWRSLSERPDVVVRWAQLRGSKGYVRPGPPIVITLDSRLGRRERRSVLAHELEHVEQDSYYSPDSPEALRQKLEDRVDRAATDKLVPPDELDAMAAEADEHGLALGAWELMERFDVSIYVAQRAMGLRDVRQRRTR